MMNYYRNICFTLVLSGMLVQPILMAVDEVIVKTADGASISIPRHELRLAHTFNDFISTDKLISSFTDPNFDPTLTPLQELDLTKSEAFSSALYEVKAYLDELYNFYIERAQIGLPPGAPVFDDHFDTVRQKNRLDAISQFMREIPEQMEDTTSFIDLLYAGNKLGVAELVEACLIYIINRKDLQRSHKFIKRLLNAFPNHKVELNEKLVDWLVPETAAFHPMFATNTLTLDFDQAIFINSLYREKSPSLPFLDIELLDFVYSLNMIARTVVNVHTRISEEKPWLTTITNILAQFCSLLLSRLVIKLNLKSKYLSTRDMEGLRILVPPPHIFEPFFKNAFKKFTLAQRRSLSENVNFKFLPSNTERYNICNRLIICCYFLLEWHLFMLLFDDLHIGRQPPPNLNRINSAFFVAVSTISLMVLHFKFIKERDLSLEKLIDSLYDKYMRGFFGDEKIEDLIAPSHEHED